MSTIKESCPATETPAATLHIGFLWHNIKIGQSPPKLAGDTVTLYGTTRNTRNQSLRQIATPAELAAGMTPISEQEGSGHLHHKLEEFNSHHTDAVN